MSKLFEEATIEVEETLDRYTQENGILVDINQWSRDDLIKIKSLIDLALQDQRKREKDVE
jgi:hypothetical protein